MDTNRNSGTRSSEEIRADIERTRADLHETVDQLESRISPGQLLDELWGRMRAGGAGGAGDIVRDHPIPLALMGLGVAMMAMDRTTGRSGSQAASHGSQGYVGSTERAEGRVGPYRGDDVDGVKFNDRVVGVDSTSDGHAEGGLKDRAGELLNGVREHASHLAEGAGERLGSARAGAGDTASRAVGGLDRVIHDQPLIAGAVSFALGLATALAAPSTKFENERIGERADQLKETAKEAASEVGDRVKAVASEAASTAKEAAREMKDVANDDELKQALVSKAREVADVAKRGVTDVVGAVGGTKSDSGEASTGPTGQTGPTGPTGSSTGGMS